MYTGGISLAVGCSGKCSIVKHPNDIGKLSSLQRTYIRPGLYKGNSLPSDILH